MKYGNLVLALAIGLIGMHATVAHAVELLCDSEYSDGTDDLGSLSGHQVLFKGNDVLTCNAELPNPFNKDANAAGLVNEGEFVVQFPGVGLGLRATANEVGSIFCPTIPADKLGTEKGISKLYGVKVAAGFFLGADAAVFVGKDAGMCIVTGLQLMVEGASVVGAEMDVTRVDALPGDDSDD